MIITIIIIIAVAVALVCKMVGKKEISEKLPLLLLVMLLILFVPYTHTLL